MARSESFLVNLPSITIYMIMITELYFLLRICRASDFAETEMDFHSPHIRKCHFCNFTFYFVLFK